MNKTRIIRLVTSIIVIFVVVLIIIIFVLYSRSIFSDKTYVEIKCSDLVNNTSVDKVGELGNVVWEGEIVEPGQLPHMALIISPRKGAYNGSMCGGTLISQYFVMTAGHCFNTTSQYDTHIFLGLYDIDDRSNTQEFKKKEVYFYNNSDHYKEPYDIALIRLDRAVEFSSYIRPICLNRQLNIDMEGLTASGWGRNEGENYSRKLRRVFLEPMPYSECEKQFSNRFAETYYVCAGHSTKHRDVCQGDSGGPLQLPLKSEVDYTFLQVGIVSHGKSCKVPGQISTVGTYTKVAFYISWIDSVVWK